MYHHKASCISCIARGMEIDTTLRWYRGQGSTCQHRRFKRRRFGLWVRKNSWRRKWQPALVFLPGKFHEQRSLTDYSLWDSKELDTTEHARTHTHTHTHTHELSVQSLEWDTTEFQFWLTTFYSLTLGKITSLPLWAFIFSPVKSTGACFISSV